ncbi:prophage side tail fiber protein homolog StfR-like [Ovis canadensis]|uniref:prophage side tail fiber protein homolog StfR-like n=1 Tax=Ovis canadensis TaxID=37174 RepID=UPI00375137C8
MAQDGPASQVCLERARDPSAIWASRVYRCVGSISPAGCSEVRADPLDLSAIFKASEDPDPVRHPFRGPPKGSRASGGRVTGSSGRRRVLDSAARPLPEWTAASCRRGRPAPRAWPAPSPAQPSPALAGAAPGLAPAGVLARRLGASTEQPAARVETLPASAREWRRREGRAPRGDLAAAGRSTNPGLAGPPARRTRRQACVGHAEEAGGALGLRAPAFPPERPQTGFPSDRHRPSRGAACRSRGAACRSRGAACRSRGAACRSRGAACRSRGAACRSRGAACRSRGAACRSRGAACRSRGAACRSRGAARPGEPEAAASWRTRAPCGLGTPTASAPPEARP